MKKNDLTVEDMIMRFHYLEALEIEFRVEKTLFEMERQDFIDTIYSLKDTMVSLRTSMDSLREFLEENSRC